uniref:Uncharacterized protein n=1 Tax=Plectus sambesii TaxID=2011161 RepID=A0A914X9Q8_9BILA
MRFLAQLAMEPSIDECGAWRQVLVSLPSVLRRQRRAWRSRGGRPDQTSQPTSQPAVVLRPPPLFIGERTRVNANSRLGGRRAHPPATATNYSAGIGIQSWKRPRAVVSVLHPGGADRPTERTDQPTAAVC